MAWWKPLLAGLAHSAAMLLAAPPLGLWPAALLSILPLVIVGCCRSARPWRDTGLVFVGVMPCWLVWQAWTIDVTGAGYVPFAAACALASALFVPLLWLVRRHAPRVPLALCVPLLWTGLEVLRGEHAFDGYAWGFAGHPLIDAPWLARPAAWGGYYLVSALLGLLTGAVLDVRRGGPAGRAGLAGLAVWLVFLVAGVLARPEPGGRVVRVGAVQTNVPQSNKMGWTLEDEDRDMARFVALTRDASGAGAEIIAWPETMMPGITLEPDAQPVLGTLTWTLADGRVLPADTYGRAIESLQRELGVPMLVGEEARVGLRAESGDGGIRLRWRDRYNSVYLVEGGRTSPLRYDKLRLTPFGEVMPYIHLVPRLQEALLDFAATGMSFDLATGTAPTVFSVRLRDGGTLRAVTPICFESTVAGVCRELVYHGGERRADLIVNVTNDGWFGGSRLARLQHLQAARWRSLELGTPTLRAANTGICAVIDATGKVTAWGVDGAPGAAERDGVLVADVKIPSGATLYARVGDGPAWATLAGAGVLVVWAGWARTREKRRAKKGAAGA